MESFATHHVDAPLFRAGRLHYLICLGIFSAQNLVLTFPNFFNTLHTAENSFMIPVH